MHLFLYLIYSHLHIRLMTASANVYCKFVFPKSVSMFIDIIMDNVVEFKTTKRLTLISFATNLFVRSNRYSILNRLQRNTYAIIIFILNKEAKFRQFSYIVFFLLERLRPLYLIISNIL